MKLLSIISLSALVAVSAATPANIVARQETPACPAGTKKYVQSTTFSVEKPNPLGAAQLKATPPQAGLRFPGFQSVDLTTVLAALNPPSSPEKPWCTVSQALDGVAGTLQLLADGGFGTKTFNLKRFAYACALDQGASPRSCTIKVTGQRLDNKIVEQTLKYNTKGLTGNTFASVTFNQPDFSQLKTVTLQVTSQVTGVSLLLDDIYNDICA